MGSKDACPDGQGERDRQRRQESAHRPSNFLSPSQITQISLFQQWKYSNTSVLCMLRKAPEKGRSVRFSFRDWSHIHPYLGIRSHIHPHLGTGHVYTLIRGLVTYTPSFGDSHVYTLIWGPVTYTPSVFPNLTPDFQRKALDTLCNTCGHKVMSLLIKCLLGTQNKVPEASRQF